MSWRSGTYSTITVLLKLLVSWLSLMAFQDLREVVIYPLCHPELYADSSLICWMLRTYSNRTSDVFKTAKPAI
ncbi:uncharacterized protein BYT42DRAFT_579501 [Radiomyces spectabilis]|uniref:uncharacterized protein n=1 Tax=Radiomyces spectabilis TaxID=64574 RepID=UPI00222038B8|nr:uncharacterized protein BYT42DRAFT_579501 [Radiomyces spectabilis]KAI8373182.1 hypothetical protein BYT42DRAFT_579501 [Radiomyces spectabilis]